MFEPCFIGVFTFPNDLIRQLIQQKQQILRSRYPQFQAQFQSIEYSLKNHRQQLKKNWSLNTDKETIDKVLEELQLNYYRFNRKSMKSKQVKDKQKIRKTIDLSENKPKVNPLPYHHKKFKKSLNKFDLSCREKRENKLQWKSLRKRLDQNYMNKSPTIRVRQPLSLKK